MTTKNEENRFIKLATKIQKELRDSLNKDNPPIEELQFQLSILGSLTHLVLVSFIEGPTENQLNIFDIWANNVREMITLANKLASGEVH